MIDDILKEIEGLKNIAENLTHISAKNQQGLSVNENIILDAAKNRVKNGEDLQTVFNETIQTLQNGDRNKAY